MPKPNQKHKQHKPVVKEPKPNKYIKHFALLGILILTAIVFSNSLNNGFVGWDDTEYITNNPYIKNLSFSGIKEIFSTFYLGNYHPLTTLTYAIEFNSFGLNPAPYHTTNLIFHLLNVILVFVFIQLLTKKTNVSVIVVLFFAIHPMHVESVVWISERKDVMYAFFYLGALISYLYYLKNNFHFKYLFITILLFLCSLLSKSMAVTLPVILLLIDYYNKRTFNKKVIFEKIPFFILSILFGFIAIKSQNIAEVGEMTPSFNLINNLFFASYGIVFYIFKLFIPVNLCAVHYFPEKINGILPVVYYIAPAVILLIIWGIYKAGKHKKELIFGSLFFLISILLVIQLIPVGKAVVAERYTYIPYIGLFFIIGQFYNYISKKFKALLITLLIVYTIFFAFTTYNRNKIWKDSITLFTDVIEKYPYIAYGYEARALAKIKINDVQGVIIDLDKAIELKQDYIEAYNIRGATKYNLLKDFQGALKDYTKVLELNPTDAFAYNNCGLVKHDLQDYHEAIKYYTKAIKLKPDYTNTYFNRACTYNKLQNYEKAIADYTKTIELKPDYAEAYHNRGLAKFNLQNYDDAIKDYTKAIELKPDYTQAYYNRAIINFSFKNNHEVINDLNKVVALKPDYAKAYNNRGNAKYYLEDLSGACKDWHKAFQLGFTDAQQMLQQYCK